MMTSNLFVIANVKQLRTDGGFRSLLPFFRTSWVGGVLNIAIFNSFHNRVEFGTILEGHRNFFFFFWGGGGFEHPQTPPTLRTPLLPAYTVTTPLVYRHVLTSPAKSASANAFNPLLRLPASYTKPKLLVRRRC